MIHMKMQKRERTNDSSSVSVNAHASFEEACTKPEVCVCVCVCVCSSRFKCSIIWVIRGSTGNQGLKMMSGLKSFNAVNVIVICLLQPNT